MSGLYKYLEGELPLKRLMVSVLVGLSALAMVLYCGLTSPNVRPETACTRGLSAGAFACLVTFIVLMSVEEYAIYKTKRELEYWITSATETECDEFGGAVEKI